MAINMICTLQSFLPLLKKAVASGHGRKLSYSQACIVNMTSKMGSIDDNTSGGYYPYRASKVGTHQISVSGLITIFKKEYQLC